MPAPRPSFEPERARVEQGSAGVVGHVGDAQLEAEPEADRKVREVEGRRSERAGSKRFTTFVKPAVPDVGVARPFAAVSPSILAAASQSVRLSAVHGAG